MSDNRLCGPVTSPSTWPLDNVPAPIMDGIIEEFRRFDEAEAHKSRSKPTPKKEEPYFGHFPDRPRIKVLGPHTSKLSLVSKSFRQATTRGIFTCVDLKTSRSIHLIKAQLGSGARSHVTHLTIRKDTQDRKILDKSIKETAKFISSLPKLEAIYDDSQAFLHQRMPLPKNIKFIGITLKDGKSVPESLDCRSVFCLRISASLKALKESENNLEATFWHSKVSALLRKIDKDVTMLTFRMPGLSTCGCSHQGSPIPRYHHLRSPLENVSFGVTFLHLYLPFCSAIPGHQREDQWWAYLGWLIGSKGKFQHLHLTMGWDMTLLRGPSASGFTVQESLGMGYIHFGGEPGQTGPASNSQTIESQVDDATKSFFCKVLARHPELKRITLTTVGEIDDVPPINLRTVVVRANGQDPQFSQNVNPGLMLFIESVLDTISAGYMPTFPHQWTTQDLFDHLNAHPPGFEELWPQAGDVPGNASIPPSSDFTGPDMQ